MASGPADIPITSLRGGLNATDPPQEIGTDECTQAENVEFFSSSLGERRKGCVPVSLTSSGLTVESNIAHISQWFPTNVITSPEVIAVASTPGVSASAARRDTGGTWHVLTPNDAINTSAPDVFGISTQSLDANNFISYHSGVDRLHLIDTTATFRRAGLAQPAAPTVATTGSGGYKGTRYFRVRYIIQSGSVIVVRSEPSLATTFTPPGTGLSARITKPASISENETHWEVEASEDNANFYRIATVVVGTTTYDDSTVGPKTFPAPRGAGAPVSNDGTSITYVLLSDRAAALNLTGTISNGGYGDPANTIPGRGWIGYTSGDVYIPAWWPAWAPGQKWYASPDVATALEAAASGGSSSSGTYPQVGTISDAIGSYILLPSARYLAVDGDRLIYGGHWTNTAQMSTVGWTPVKGDPGVGNSERAPIVTTGGTNIVTTVDLDNYDGGPLTGIAASTSGTWYAFKWQRIYSAIRNGNVSQAYDINTVSTSKGAIPGSIVKASDTSGGGAIYFLDPFVGPCKLGNGGIVYPIHGLRNIWSRVNLKATTVVCCGAFYPYKQQVRWWLSVDGGNAPSLCIVIQASELQHKYVPNTYQSTGELTKGVSTTTGLAATATAVAAITSVLGTQTTDVPFIGLPSPNFIQQIDNGTDDNGTTFTATIKSKPLFLAGILNKWAVRATSFMGTADANGAITVGLIRDEGLETKFSSSPITSLAPVGTEAQVIIPLDDLNISELRSVQILLTDGVTGKNWQAQRVDLKPTLEERG